MEVSVSHRQRDIISAYNSPQRDLHHYIRLIISIAHGMSSIVVQKYMVQPLYFADRCLSSWNNRQEVVGLLRSIEQSPGLPTEYRVKGLASDWYISYDLLSVQESDSR